MKAPLIRFGVDFRRAAIEAREQFSFSAPQASALLRSLPRKTIAEAMMVATCNRTELYAVCESPEAAVRALVGALRAARPHIHPDYQDCLRFHSEGEEAVAQLFRVAAGLESQILGDSHVLTQVRQAMEAAREAGTLGPVLRTTAEHAVRCAKQVRRQTGLSAGSAGVGAAVLRSVRRHVQPERETILVLGGGRVARDALHHLSKSRPARLEVAARRREVAMDLAACFGARAIGWDQVRQAVSEAGVVVTAISARLEDWFVQALSEDGGKLRLVVDTGVPRNVPPDAALLAGLRLVDLDALEREQQQALREREQRIPAAEAIVAAGVARLRRALAWRAVEPDVKALYLAAERMRTELVLGPGCLPELDRATSRLMRKWLDGPVRRLRTAVLTADDNEAERAIWAFREMASACGGEDH